MTQELEKALQDARANEASALVAHNQKKTARDIAKRTKDALISSAAAGVTVQPDDVMGAEMAVQRSKVECSISEQVHAGAQKLRHAAEIEYWHQQAATLQGDVAAAIDRRIAAAYAIDSAVKTLESALRDFHEQGESLLTAVQRASNFNADAEARTKTNPVLAKMESPTRPAVRGSYRANIRKLRFSISEAGTFQDMPSSIKDIGIGEARIAGRRPLASPTPA